MNTSEYRKHVKALASHAVAMSVEGLQGAIKDDWNEPKWPSVLFDAMNRALELKMGKRAYAQWFNSLDSKSEA